MGEVTTAARSFLALVVLLLLLGGVVVGAELVVRSQVDSTFQDTVEDELARLTDADGSFEQVETDVAGYALLGLLRGRFDAVTVTARDGVVGGVAIPALDVAADRVSPDGRRVDSLEVRVRADAAALLASQVADEAAAESLRSTAEVTAPDRIAASLPVELPVLGAQQVDVEVEVRPQDGGIVVTPTRATLPALGEALDLAQLGVLTGFALEATTLPGGLQLDGIRLEATPDRPELVADLSCDRGCSLR